MAASKTSIISTHHWPPPPSSSATLPMTSSLGTSAARHLSSALAGLLHRLSSEFTVIIEEYEGIAVNQLYSSAEVYVGSISSSSTRRVQAGKSEKDRSITIAAEQGQYLTDIFDGIRLNWVLIHLETINRTMCSHGDYGSSQEQHYYPGRGETWTSVNFDHPATFETLAMEPDVKRSHI